MIGMSTEFLIVHRVGWRQGKVLRSLLSLRLLNFILDFVGCLVLLVLHESLIVFQFLTLLFEELDVYLLNLILKLSLLSMGLQFQSIHVEDIKNMQKLLTIQCQFLPDCGHFLPLHDILLALRR